ncbi:SDR family NAD(P)-dependent oxidoreductase [Aeromicrobium sp.]|uniref:SDR family NAD(P)-dependent oxidoreductase n=1 Tax=Aeromicrobium sp. TaxID=1871063 RepID=UPI002FC599D2
MKSAVVTGASSGIGAASARALAAAGYHVICAARRIDRLNDLAREINGTAIECDITDAAQVANLAAQVGDSLNVLVNNAGGAFGSDPVIQSDPDQWRRMYEINVIGTMQVTKALVPALIASGAGTIINIGSTAGRWAYEGGGGYTAAKHGVAVLTETLRLELNGQPVRVSEIAPGMVHTEEFSLVRLGDKSKADAVYAGVAEPLLAEDIADAVQWVATRPQHVNVDLMIVKPIAQAAAHKVHRSS